MFLYIQYIIITLEPEWQRGYQYIHMMPNKGEHRGKRVKRGRVQAEGNPLGGVCARRLRRGYVGSREGFYIGI